MRTASSYLSRDDVEVKPSATWWILAAASPSRRYVWRLGVGGARSPSEEDGQAYPSLNHEVLEVAIPTADRPYYWRAVSLQISNQLRLPLHGLCRAVAMVEL
jgi:hypothetical protein